MAIDVVKRARVTAMVFGVLVCITLISIVYSFIQQAEAKKQALLAQQAMSERKEIELKVEVMARMLEENNKELQKVHDELRNSLQTAQDKLQKCNCK
jgi:Flp pilus assembly protein TadB